MKILIVEDDKNLANSLKVYLEKKGYTADFVLDGETGERRLELYHDDYDLAIVDWMLPKKTGDEVVKSVREKGMTVPILMLTAKDSVMDKITGLNVGADDYLAKPFSNEELLARVRALFRRPRVALPIKLSAGELMLDTTNRKVFLGGKEIELTLKEFALLEYFLRNPNRVLNREQIFNHLWDFSSNAMSNVIDVHIYFLRKKIGMGYEKLIETVPGVGYRLKV